MALINCPECGREVSDKAEHCIHCGFPLIDYLIDNEEIHNKLVENRKNTCPYCGHLNDPDEDYCESCEMRLTSYNKIAPKHEGIYKYSKNNIKHEIFCPRCGSIDCSHFREEVRVPERTKTRYTVNLNPLKPFTLLNKKEKTVRKEKIIYKNKIKCNKCGNVFE